ncbi:MAG TPA: YciI family protein [Candidatus Binatus sp.]|nr:YciI family protein [Candidatus Binatus sp.]
MKTETTTGEYMLLFRGPHWDKGLSTDELQQTMDKVMVWFEGLNQRGKVKAGQPLGAQGRTISGTNGRFVVDGPFTETKEAVGGYLLLQADSFDEAVEIARSAPALRYGVSVEVRPILAECPIFARHPEIVRRAKDRAVRADELWAAVAA